MAIIILSGVGGSSNWLPLILPLVAIVLLLKLGEITINIIKRKRLSHEVNTDDGVAGYMPGNEHDHEQL